MELPAELKTLYRHWSEHTAQQAKQVSPFSVFQNEQLFKEISTFIHARMSIWEKKYMGVAPPYSNDSILSTYRFCNIFRELDRQTIEYHTLLNPLRDDFPLWLLNMFYCRLVARPETVHFVGLLSFERIQNEVLYERLIAHARPRYGTPYVFPISTIVRSATPTREEFIARHLPSVMEGIANEISSWKKISVTEGVQRVIPLFGFNQTFLWTEVLIDVAYQFLEKIDLYKSFPVGPGSLPTFKRINPNKEPSELAVELGRLGFETSLTYEGIPLKLSAENWEGVGCEFRKYINLKSGKGRKRIFKT